MRSFLAAAVALVALAQPSLAATWYVTTTGSDGADGTSLGTAFATWQRGIDAASAGDTILISPGTYTVATANGARVNAKSGSGGSPITMRGNGGRPVLNCTNIANAFAYCLRVINSNYWTLRDLELANLPQTGADGWSIGLDIVNASNLIVDRVVIHHTGGPGVSIGGTSGNNTIQDSDSYYNYDPGTSGGNADGFQVSTVSAGYPGNQLIRTRAWSNSDDGYDLWETESAVTITESWSFWNGYIPGTGTAAGDGNGFKTGRNDDGPTHVITKNAAFANRGNGFDSNAGTGAQQIYANTAFDNEYNYQFTDPANGTHALTNNISYVPRAEDIEAATGVVQTQNSWNIGVTLTGADFSSVDDTGMDAARASTGVLPNLPFLRPISCDIINRSSINLACCGRTLGAFGRYIDPPVGFRRALPAAAMLGTPPE